MPVRWNGRRSRNFWNLRRACSVLVMCSWFTAQDFTSRFLLHLGFYPLKAYPCMVIRVLRQSVAFSTWYTDVEMLADIYLSGSRRDSSPHCDSRRAVVHHLASAAYLATTSLHRSHQHRPYRSQSSREERVLCFFLPSDSGVLSQLQHRSIGGFCRGSEPARIARHTLLTCKEMCILLGSAAPVRDSAPRWGIYRATPTASECW